MQIFTLWRRESSDDDETPWATAIVDEYSVLENGYPEDYAKERKDPNVREVIIEVPDSVIRKLFQPVKIVGKVIE